MQARKQQASVKEPDSKAAFCTPKQKRSAAMLLERVAKHLTNTSDPAIMRAILVNLKFDTFKTQDGNMMHFLKLAASKPMNLSPLIEKLRSNFLENEATCALLAAIQDKNLMTDKEIAALTKNLNLQLNIICLLEAMTITVVNSPTLAKDIYEHNLKLRDISFPGNPFYTFMFGAPRSASLFERLKLISIEPGIVGFVFHKEMGTAVETEQHVKDFIKKHGLSSLNADIVAAVINREDLSGLPNMAINIVEAMWEDKTGKSKDKGGKDNAVAGLGLIQLMEYEKYPSRFVISGPIVPEGIELEQKHAKYPILPELSVDVSLKKHHEFLIDKEWRDLYNSWNMRFVFANIDTVFLPMKLLLPSVFSQKVNNYKETRMLSLYIIGNMFLGGQLDKNPFFKSEFNLEKGAEILSLWGKINKEYATFMIKKLCPDVLETPEAIYNQLYDEHPTRALFSNLYSFMRHPKDFRITSSTEKAKEDDELSQPVVIHKRKSH